jgi:hypothetical protein
LADVDGDVRQFAELLQRLDDESPNLVEAAVYRLKRDHDGRFTAILKAHYRRRFRSERERSLALWNLVVDRSASGWQADTDYP